MDENLRAVAQMCERPGVGEVSSHNLDVGAFSGIGEIRATRQGADLMTPPEQGGDEMAAEKSRGPGDGDARGSGLDRGGRPREGASEVH